MRAAFVVFVATSACWFSGSTGPSIPPLGDICSCDVTTLAHDQLPSAFGIDDQNVYWSTAWRGILSPPISSVRDDGTTATVSPGSGYTAVGTIIADANHVYARADTVAGIQLFPKDGKPSTLIEPAYAVSEVRLDQDGDLLWAGHGGLWKKPPGQMSVQVVAGDVETFAADAAGFYWWGLDREIRSTPTPIIASADVPAGGLAADGAALYWIDTKAQTVNVAPHGGAPRVLLAGLGQGLSNIGLSPIAVDDAFVYVTGDFAQRSAVVRIPKAGGAPLVLYAGTFVTGVAVDDAAVYTTDTQDDSTSILRIAKP